MTPALRQILFSGGGYCPETRAILAAMTGVPDARYRADLDRLVRGLIADGDWASLDWLMYLGCPTNRTDAMLNLKQLGKSGAEFGTMTWTPDRGFLNPSGNTAGITIEAPTAAGNNATVNSLHISIYINAFLPKDFGGFIVSNGGGQAYIGQTTTTAPTEFVASKIGDNTYATTITSPSNSAYIGHHLSSRTGASARAFYLNGVSLVSDATAQTGAVNTVIRLLATDGGVNMDSPNVATQAPLFTMGPGVSPAAAARVSGRFLTFLSARGAA